MTPTSKTERFINLRERREALHVTQAESVWLTQKRMAELFDVDVRTVNEHLQNIYDSEELSISSTIRNFRIVQNECEQEEITVNGKTYVLKEVE